MGVTYIYEEHLVDRQAAAEEAMLKEFEAGHYTIQNPLVKYNLYFISPLTAVVCFETEEETMAYARRRGICRVAVVGDTVREIRLENERGKGESR